MNTINQIMIHLESNDAYILDQGEDGLIAILHGPRGIRLDVIVSWGDGWDHVSVVPKIHVSPPQKDWGRMPTWEEMCFVKDFFFGLDETVVQYHPSSEDYVNLHPHCLHLWRPQDVDLPKPPKIFV